MTMEMSEAIIDYVPSHPYRKGGLCFRQDPRKYHPQLRAKGYAEPWLSFYSILF